MHATPPHAKSLKPAPAGLPRGLVVGGCAWLAASWIMAIGWRPPVQPVVASYAPGVRTMLVFAVLGAGLLYPLGRLVGPGRPRPIASGVLDLVVLACLAQVLVWPLRLVTRWPIDRALLVDATACAWLVVIVAVVVLAESSRTAAARTAGMVVVVGMLVAGPTAALLMREPALGDAWSPLTAIAGIGAEEPLNATPAEWWAAIGPAVAGSALWLALAMRSRRSRA